MPGRLRKLVAAAALGLACPRGLHAEDSLAYKYEDYREADGRVAVQTQSARATQDLGTDWNVALSGTVDAIAGATPSGVPAPAGQEQVPLLPFHERRKAWALDVSHTLAAVTLVGGFAYSRESDYTSYGWSLNTVTAFNQNNTTLTAGIAGTDDNVEVFQPGPPWRRKHSETAIVGASQALGPNTLLKADLSWGRLTGYLSDPYKLVAKTVAILPGLFLPETFAENRPDFRDKGTFLVALNQAVPPWRAALEASNRLYADTFGIRSDTVEFTWLQRLGRRVIVEPNLRYARQSAASFYFYNLDAAAVVPVPEPNGTGPFYSSDYRLSALQTLSPGVKLVWQPLASLQLDLAFNRYEMHGTDDVTPRSAYPRAKITTGGVKFLW